MVSGASLASDRWRADGLSCHGMSAETTGPFTTVHRP